MTLSNPNFNKLIEDHELSALISEPASFKSINPTGIVNFLTSKKNSFYEYSNTVSNHRKLIVTML